MKLKVATTLYPMTRFKSESDWKKFIEDWIVEAISHSAELILFPEYASMDISAFMIKDDHKLEDELNNIQHLIPKFKNLFQSLALKHKILIISPSIPEKIGNHFYNRAYIFFPSGKIDYQDKKMMTRFENEEWHISGSSLPIKVFEFQKIKFAINICYDSEFPLLTHQACSNGAELILVPSCTESLFGMNRIHVACRARALENQCYVLVSQTIGEAPWLLSADKNTGKAALYSTCDYLFPEDGILFGSTINEAGIYYYELDFDLIDKVRKTGQVFNFRDSNQTFKLKN